MPSETIQTNDPFLDLANISSYTTGSGQPIISLPIGTTIRCRAVAEGIIEDPTWGEIPGSIEKLTGTVNLIEDLGNNSRFASDIRVTFNGDGTLNAEVDTFSDDADGGYDSVEWEVVDSSGGPGFPITTEPISNYNRDLAAGVRDFEGRYFVWGDSGSGETEIDTTIDTYTNPIRNANFIIGVEREPSPDDAGVVQFDWEPEFLRDGDQGIPSTLSVPAGVATHVTWQEPGIWDPFSNIQDRPPQLSHWPPQPDDLDSSYTVNQNWIPIRVVNGEFDAFGVDTHQGELISWIETTEGGAERIRTYGFTVTQDYAKNLIIEGLNLECDRRGISRTAANRKLIMEGTKDGDGTVAPYYNILPTGMMIWGLANSIVSFFILEYEEQTDGNIRIIFDIENVGGITTAYLHFALFGQGAWLLDKPHSFTLDLANKKIRYRHNQSTPPPQVFASKPKTCDMNIGSNGGFFVKADTALENSSITFSLNEFNSYLIRDRNNSGDDFDIKMNNCKVRFPVNAGVMTKYFEFVDSELIWALTRGFGLGRKGCLIKRSSFTGCERSSATSYRQGFNEDDTPEDGWGPWIIEECIYNLLYSNHGQGISSYQGSWINFQIRNNIFLNCQRAASFQATPGAWDGGKIAGLNWADLSTYTFGGYVFENNLICYTRNLTKPQVGGQWGHAWNGKINTDFFDSRQAKARIRNNTYIIAPHIEEEGWREDFGFRTFVGLQVASSDLGTILDDPFKLTVEGNVGLLRQYRDDAIVDGVDKNQYSNQNLWLNPTEVTSTQTFSSTDLFSPKDTSTNRELSYPDNLYYLYDTGQADKRDWIPVVRSDVETKYRNNGIQWDNPPTFRQLESLDKTWSSSVTFRSLPDHTEGIMTEPGVDNRPYVQTFIASGSGVFSGPNEKNDYSLSSVENLEGNLFDLNQLTSIWCYDSPENNTDNKYVFRGWLDVSTTGILQELYGDEPDPATGETNRATRLEEESFVEIYFNDVLVAEKKQLGAATNQPEYINFLGSNYTFYRDDGITDAIIGPSDGDTFRVDLFSFYPDYTGY